MIIASCDDMKKKRDSGLFQAALLCLSDVDHPKAAVPVCNVCCPVVALSTLHDESA